ncbi:MAG TPA: hypothetical protein VNR60_02300 [Croceibacterium sp.]|nr:hypothetical protein [Croceibacterium sp.]
MVADPAFMDRLMELKFRVAARIARPVHEVFEAVANPQQLSSYFTTGGASARLETGATVMWDFHDYPGALEASDGEAPNVDGGKLEDAGFETTVTTRFTALEDGRTLVEISGCSRFELRQLPRLDGDAAGTQSLAGARRQLA